MKAALLVQLCIAVKVKDGVFGIGNYVFGIWDDVLGIWFFVVEQARKSSEDAQAAGYAQFEKVWAR